jgi:hypothetical protein
MSRKIIPVATVSVSVNYIRYLTCFKHSLFLDIKFLVEFCIPTEPPLIGPVLEDQDENMRLHYCLCTATTDHAEVTFFYIMIRIIYESLPVVLLDLKFSILREVSACPRALKVVLLHRAKFLLEALFQYVPTLPDGRPSH